MMRIAIGPPLFDWGKRALRDFYRRMAFETTADILYLGEVVCSKRFHLDPEELAALVRELQPAGKELVFSTLGLVMNEGELNTTRRLIALAGELGILFEANDMAAVGIGERQPMVAGPHITTYNRETLTFLAKVGVKRVVLPVELSESAMAAIIGPGRPAGVEAEVFAYGKLPLTFSARCYTARAFKLPKSNCQYKCGEFPDGMEVKTQEGEAFITVNGIQTMSAKPFNAITEVDKLAAMGVDILRLSPQSQEMAGVIAVWRERLDGRIDGHEALARLDALNGQQGFCNGYLHGKAGLAFFGEGEEEAE